MDPVNVKKKKNSDVQPEISASHWPKLTIWATMYFYHPQPPKNKSGFIKWVDPVSIWAQHLNGQIR